MTNLRALYYLVAFAHYDWMFISFAKLLIAAFERVCFPGRRHRLFGGFLWRDEVWSPSGAPARTRGIDAHGDCAGRLAQAPASYFLLEVKSPRWGWILYTRHAKSSQWDLIFFTFFTSAMSNHPGEIWFFVHLPCQIPLVRLFSWIHSCMYVGLLPFAITNHPRELESCLTNMNSYLPQPN